MKKYFLLLCLMTVLGLTACGSFSGNISSAFRPAEPELTEEEKAAIRREEQLIPLLEEADALALGYYYEEALQCLENVPEEFSEDADVLATMTLFRFIFLILSYPLTIPAIIQPP